MWYGGSGVRGYKSVFEVEALAEYSRGSDWNRRTGWIARSHRGQEDGAMGESDCEFHLWTSIRVGWFERDDEMMRNQDG